MNFTFIIQLRGPHAIPLRCDLYRPLFWTGHFGGAGSPEYAGPVQPVTAERSLEELNNSPIQDNSFLVEEAYNQEDGVIQHISLFQRLSTGDWAFTQTDEWPLRS